MAPYRRECGVFILFQERKEKMANDKKLVEAITSMDVDFAQWYTDVV